MTTPNPDVVEAVRVMLVDAALDPDRDMVEAGITAYHDYLASQGIELVKRGDVPPWMKQVQPAFGALAALYVNTEGTADAE